MTAARILAYLWALPTTLAGLLLALLAVASGGRARRVQGVVEAHGGLVKLLLERATLLPGGAAALTLGHVVLGRSAELLAASRSHERAHVRQAERWGPLFVPAYLVACLAARARGGHWYRDNRFERDARRAAGDEA
jgi:hypothetical protein